MNKPLRAASTALDPQDLRAVLSAGLMSFPLTLHRGTSRGRLARGASLPT